MQIEILEQITKLEDYKWFEKIIPEIESNFKRLGININNKY